MSLKQILKEEFSDVEISSDAWDMTKSLNMFSRNIQAIIGEHTSSKTTILTGGKGKFVWIQYHNPNDILGDGGVASGNIENRPIHNNGRFFDDVNYSGITFALIPVDDF